jgi:hypothetical protein
MVPAPSTSIGGPARKNALTALNATVIVPIPSAIVTTATAANPGFFASDLQA